MFTLDITKRLVLFVIAFFLFKLYSRLAFVLFMFHEGIFSYDFFTDGLFGLDAFYVSTEATVIFISFACLSSVSYLIGYKSDPKRVDKQMWATAIWTNVVCNTIVLIVLLMHGLTWENVKAVVGFYFVLFYVAFVIGWVYLRESEGRWKRFFISFGALVLATVLCFQPFVLFLKDGLRYFGCGGDLDVTMILTGQANDETISGKLILLSPTNVFIRTQCGGEVEILSRARLDSFKIAPMK